MDVLLSSIVIVFLSIAETFQTGTFNSDSDLAQNAFKMINDDRNRCITGCNLQEDECNQECSLWSDRMARKSGFTIQGDYIFPFETNSQSLPHMKTQARAITAFQESCQEKCSYTGASCVSCCEGEAMDSIQHLQTRRSPRSASDSVPHGNPIDIQITSDDYLRECHLNCRALKQRCVSRLQKNGIDTGDAYFVCAAVEDECQSLCTDRTTELISLSSTLGTSFPSVDLADDGSTYIDLSLLRPSIPQQLFGPKKSPARKMGYPNERRSQEIEKEILAPRMRREREGSEVTREKERCPTLSVASPRSSSSADPSSSIDYLSHPTFYQTTRYPVRADGMGFELPSQSAPIGFPRPPHSQPSPHPPTPSSSSSDPSGCRLTKADLLAIIRGQYLDELR